MNLTPDQIELAIQGVAVAIAVFWVYIFLDRTRWWPSQWSLHLDAAAREPVAGEHGDVAVIIPARNEAAILPRTLPRLLKQAAWFRQLIIVDDRSRDQTASSARRLADGTLGETHLRVVSLRETEDGWSGKTFARHRGYEAAAEDWPGDPTRQWLLFTDADILHPTFSIGRLLNKATKEDLDLVSVMVKLRARTFWEWLLIPAFVYFFQLLYPFRKVSAAGSRRAGAAGGVMLVRRSAFDAAGGFEAIQNATIDDVALARAIKRNGGKCWLGLDPDTRSLRTYDYYRTIHDMVARTAFEQLGRHYVMVPIVWLALLGLWVAPPLLALYGAWVLDPIVGGAGLAAWLMSIANYLPVVQYLGAPSGFALSMPVSALLYCVMTTASAWRHLTGSGTEWRAATEIDLTDA